MDVTVIVPCRNERAFIGGFLESLIRQQLQGITWEAIIADGMSNDGTRDIITSYSHCYPIRMVDNPERIVSAALNAAIQTAEGDYIVRMDVHTTYAADYIKKCLEVAKDTSADNVGGPWVPVGKGYVGSAIAAVFQSAFGTGGARGHNSDYEGPVDTVYLGCWHKTTFQKFGLFDVQLVRNQDDEFNLRVHRSGGTIWQSPGIVSFYHPRSSLSDLFRQYMQYGYWKVAVIRKHRIPASFRHLVPGLFLTVTILLILALIGLLVTGLSFPASVVAWSLAALEGAYFTLCVLASAGVARKNGWHLLPVLPIVFATYHISYGYGFLIGLAHFFDMYPTVKSQSRFTELTR